MLLTDKCKEEFDKWLPLVHQVIADGINGDFHSLHSSLTYGVYVDFFDIVNITIGRENDGTYFVNPKKSSNWYRSDCFKLTREEVIIKANNIYNEL